MTYREKEQRRGGERKKGGGKQQTKTTLLRLGRTRSRPTRGTTTRRRRRRGRPSRSSPSTRGSPGGAPFLVKRGTTRDAREKSRPLGHHLFVGNVGDEDKGSLEGGGEGEEEEEDSGGGIVGDNVHKETKQPRATDRRQDGEVDPQLGRGFLLLGLGLRKSLVNFSGNKEEEDNIDVEDDKTGEEKGSESGSLGLDPAKLVVNGTIVSSSNHTDETTHGNTPGKQVVELFVTLDFLVTLDDHLVEVESNNPTPAEVGDEEIVRDGSATLTERAVHNSICKGYHEE